jgi:integrase/recombinase XerD
VTDEKEKVANSIVQRMNLKDEDSKKLKNIIYIELNDYSLSKIDNTDLAIRNEQSSEEAYRMFFVAKNIQGCTRRTLKYYKDVIDEFSRFINKPLLEVTTNDVRYFLAVKKERDGVTDVTVNNLRRNISAFYSWCEDEEYINKSPLKKIKKIKEEKRVKKPFTEMEIEKMRIAARNEERLSAIIETLLSTGCRVTELVGIDRDDVQGDELVVYGKGRKERKVYLNAKAKCAIDRYLETRTDDNKALFVTLDRPNERLKMSGVEIVLRKLGRELGIENVHPHRFRRTAATFALRRGMPLDQVSKMLGHENIDTTQIYAITDQEQVKTNHKKYLS